ncbi:hypothetical protein D6D13_06347 [Aureobasidium pullulans]|uniref:C2H2-type domain-containing protein n=1 Tax=Aureobasidium pullulans TaxID=5580 RepID=A0A4S9CIH7_AURPU|nr:hypothetical protein D6D13_06347 [Aureobasidium pullulans]
MASSASPIDIATPRASPPNQTSNLTSQLQAANARSGDAQPPSFVANMERRGSEFRPDSLRRGSINMGNSFHSRPISMRDRGRRDSTNHAGSLMAGMSWGGLSVGSFIRDDLIMAGTSPYNFQSPSFHSSSYLPKMEANFMKDYICCGITLDSLHELLQHYEEAHAQVPTQTMGRTPKEHLLANARNANAGTAAQMLQQQQQSQPHNHQQAPQFDHPSGLSQGLARDPLQDHDMDDMDMDMDDSSTAPAVQDPYQSHQFQPQPQFGRQQARAPSLNIGMASAFQNTQQVNNVSTPTTPQPGQNMQLGGFNPTVSSVNTPTFGQTSQTVSPSESTVHTPGEIDPSNFNASMSGFGFPDMNGQQDESRCIDDPAKRLLSKQGGMGGFKNPSQFANNSELAKRLREQQLIQGFGFPGEEAKPFRCPVIGCEKAYKNQNGLKYHKQHGHQNQQLKENPDGTFSIVDPATSIPYPGTVGMEKEKPYRCEVCGKRYKNLNGLKYHRQHSPPCNPDLKLNPVAVPQMPNGMQAMNVNVAGAGLSMGMDDGMGY